MTPPLRTARTLYGPAEEELPKRHTVRGPAKEEMPK
jgi:hypothetical protein